MLHPQKAFWSGPQERLATAWTLFHQHRTAECAMWSHPLGWELRLTVNGSMIQTQITHSYKQVVEAGTAWRRMFRDAGWADRSTSEL